MSNYNNVLKKEERKEETKKERIFKALQEGMTPAEIINAGLGSKPLVYRYIKHFKDDGYIFNIQNKPKDDFERIQFEHNKIILDMKYKLNLTLKKLKIITNDPYYMRYADVRKAVIMTKIWEEEGWKEKYEEWVKDGWQKKYKEWIELGKPEDKELEIKTAISKLLIHSRDLHYQIDKKYKIEKYNPKTQKYESLEYNIKDSYCWKYCTSGLKLAKQIGLIPNDALKDKANPDPENVQYYKPHEELNVRDDITYTSHDVNTFNKCFDYKHVGEIIKEKAKAISKELMKPIRYYTKTAQPNHKEIWCEKSEIIPFDVARELNMEIRPCGSGEASDMMCSKAVMKAKESGKNLVVGYLTDFDPAGEGMPVTASRKIQYHAEQKGIQAFLYPIALNYKQIIKYEIPYSPPAEDNNFKKAYATRVKDFNIRWNIDSIEINAFKALKLNELKQEIRDVMILHSDDKLYDKIKDAKEELKNNIIRAIRKSLRYNIHKLKDKRKRVKNKRNKIKQKNKQQENITKQCETLKEIDLKKYVDLETNMNEKYNELTEGFEERKDKYIEALKILEDRAIEKYDELAEPYDDRKEEFEEAINILKDKTIKPYNNKRDDIIEELEHIKTKKENRIDTDLKEYKELLEINISKVLEGVEFKMPKPDVSNGENALLNTNRGYIEQLDKYIEYRKRKRDEEEC